MGEALFDLERILRSKKEPLTVREANVLMAWRAHAMRDFTVGYCGGSIVTWLATQRLRKIFRTNLSLGAGFVCGIWKFGKSVDSSVQHILSLKGSRIQGELANIMLKKYHRNPWVIQQLSKHFYTEEVYDDSSVDRPMIRWRHRNFTVDRSQNTSYGEEAHSNESRVNETTLEPKQVHVNSGGNAMENPLDLIFGFSESAENVSTPVEKVSKLSKKQRRKEKRAARRQRRHHHHHQEEESGN
ncbi:Unknown protein [Striga hermonthica]|uniref:Uncharacterized protein n=1 Tax=Striga hermonthica TaxID=68872 RepID=A0A9N7NEQ0_STRHE|nr:Unknown protein [Striga hermonthica]